jgi:NAD(P) transhydrogenase subunit beta
MNSLMLALTTSQYLPNLVYYIICAVLSILVLYGIYLMSKVKTSVLGNKLSGLALGLGIIVALMKNDILPVWVLYPSMLIGIVIGLRMAKKVSMLQMPQMIALLNGLGGAASAIVAAFAMVGIGADETVFTKSTSVIALVVGMVTLMGSLIAAGKLHKVLSQKPTVLPKHQLITTFLLLLMIGVIVVGSIPKFINPYLILIAGLIISSLFGIVFCIRVGGADMPITISLLNSLSGVAGAVAGLAIGDVLLVAIGGIVGASGLLLTQIMCKAMNRHLLEILLGKTTTSRKSITIEKKETVVRKQINPIEILRTAKTAIIVPGYGMAIAQAQHLVKRLADKLIENGTKVKYAVHPVAGRMPGHMNVLLAEANVDYDDLYELEDINSEFANVDVTIVVGANDTLNPAAREAEGTPIYGMPILNVDKSKHIVIFNYDLKPGYAGVENPIYDREGVSLVLGNAADTIAKVLNEL